jgi:hypothetical protein
MTRRHLLLAFCLSLPSVFVALTPAHADPTSASPTPQVETIICIRHGEKPPDGIGNLDPQGLNRALALPAVLLARYGKPAYIFAPDPAADLSHEGPVGPDGKKEDVSYVRPLLTIGPTAIQCGLPINADFGFKHIAALEAELDKPLYRTALIFVAWEHIQADQFIKNELKDHGGNPDVVPVWPGNDYDSIYVVKISRDGKGTPSVTFQLDHENLDGLSKDMPSVEKPAP